MKMILSEYFENQTAQKIAKDKELIDSLQSGIDLDGEVVAIEKNEKNVSMIDYIKRSQGMVFDYGTALLGFFSKRLYCMDANMETRKVCLYFEKNGIDFGRDHGSVLIGKLNEKKPVIAGIVLTNAIRRLKEKTNNHGI